jgi:hypothetical protein
MHFSNVAGTCLLALASISTAEKIRPNNILWGEMGPPQTLEKRQATKTTSTSSTTRIADSACTNGPYTRTCWSNGFNAATDFDAEWPTTGKTVPFNFELKDGTCNPDGGGSRPCQLFNGQVRFPPAELSWLKLT